MNVAQVLETSALTYPDHPGIIHGERTLTYAEWWDRARKVAAVLAELGARPGDRVALLLPNSSEFLESLYGTLAAGCVVVPINTRLHPKEYSYILEQSGSRALIFHEAYDEGVASLDIDRTATSLIRVGGGSNPGAVSYRDAVGAAGAADLVDTDPDALAWLFYTSGTTGRPKGAMVTHLNLDFMTAQFAAEVYTAGPEDRAMHAGPLTHGSGLWSIPLTAAAATHVIPTSLSFDAVEILGLLEEHAVTQIVFVSPTMIKMLLESPACATADCSSLRFLGYGGAPIHTDDLLAAMDRWGSVALQHPRAGRVSDDALDALARRSRRGCGPSSGEAPLGRPRPGRHRGRSLRRRRSASSDRRDRRDLRNRNDRHEGLLGRPCSNQRCVQGGWYHTGDLGRYDEDGFLYLLDRAKEMIISGGANIYPREVETVLLQHPAVADAAVVGIPDRHWGESIVAVVVPVDGHRVSAEELVALCKDNLASYKKPGFFVFADECPGAPTAKSQTPTGRAIQRVGRRCRRLPNRRRRDRTAASGAIVRDNSRKNSRCRPLDKPFASWGGQWGRAPSWFIS